MKERILAWDGCTNVRDLGGLRTCDGHMTRWGAIVRSDTPARLTAAGWSALYAHGIRTIITLRTHGMTENELNFTSPYPDIVSIQAEIEDITDGEFVEKWVNTNFWGTPLYFRDALQRWPERHAAVFSAIAQARPGGVLFHCIRGYDRTGIISVLLLGFVGVLLDDIVADYELSPDPYRGELLAHENSSVHDVIFRTLDGFDLDSYLRVNGVSQDDLSAVRKRFLE
jgi:protein-tyrosine phosphatase